MGLILFLVHTLMSGNWLNKHFVVELKGVLLCQVVVTFPFMRLNNVGFCSSSMKLHLVLLWGIQTLELFLVNGYSILLFDKTLGR